MKLLLAFLLQNDTGGAAADADGSDFPVLGLIGGVAELGRRSLGGGGNFGHDGLAGLKYNLVALHFELVVTRLHLGRSRGNGGGDREAGAERAERQAAEAECNSQ